MKLIILSMSCDLPFFVDEEQVVLETWAKDIVDGKYPDVSFYFIRTSENERIEGNYIYVNTEDSFFNTFEKNVRAFEMLNENNIDYDFILRTNLSTYINIPAVVNIINSYIIPDCLVKNFFGGELLSTVTGGQELLFFRGNFMLFNRIQIKFILKNKNFKHTTETDDAVIGTIFSGYFVYQPLKFGLLYSYSGYSSTTIKFDDIDSSYVYVSYRYCYDKNNDAPIDKNYKFEYDIRKKEYDICRKVHEKFSSLTYDKHYTEHLMIFNS